MATLSLPTNTPTADGATIGCTSDSTDGIVYMAARTDRQWYSVANGDSQGLADTDKATIINQAVAGAVVFVDTVDPAVVDPSVVISGLASDEYFVGWVQDAPTVYGDDMVLEINIAAPGGTFKLINRDVGVFSANIDWGDETADSTITAFDQADLEHTYTTSGNKIVRISGTYPSLSFDADGVECLKVLRVLNMGRVNAKTYLTMFKGCANLISVEASSVDATDVISMGYMFANCSTLTDCDISGFDGSACTYYYQMFYNCSGLLAVNPTGLVHAGTTEIGYMFSGCTGLTSLDVTGFITSSVSSMFAVFNNCSGVTDLDPSGFNFESATNVASFCNSVKIPTVNYDAMLISMDGQTLIPSKTMSCGTSKYSAGAAADAKASLAGAPAFWTLTDGGQV